MFGFRVSPECGFGCVLAFCLLNLKAYGKDKREVDSVIGVCVYVNVPTHTHVNLWQSGCHPQLRQSAEVTHEGIGVCYRCLQDSMSASHMSRAQTGVSMVVIWT